MIVVLRDIFVYNRNFIISSWKKSRILPGKVRTSLYYELPIVYLQTHQKYISLFSSCPQILKRQIITTSIEEILSSRTDMIRCTVINVWGETVTRLCRKGKVGCCLGCDNTFLLRQASKLLLPWRFQPARKVGAATTTANQQQKVDKAKQEKAKENVAMLYYYDDYRDVLYEREREQQYAGRRSHGIQNKNKKEACWQNIPVWWLSFSSGGILWQRSYSCYYVE